MLGRPAAVLELKNRPVSLNHRAKFNKVSQQLVLEDQVPEA